ncbi:hypothetical protein BB561_005628 [Smittium simulii]|uniref:Major facilitator superfamily (MFS) profile domain-containing protein n=1 Tax=Smittium simulii TaxID=133385 RepID=A0A2T9Y9H0_9FUNG|nr:hypothetical protein BB561_005628 [Smittium simulii]
MQKTNSYNIQNTPQQKPDQDQNIKESKKFNASVLLEEQQERGIGGVAEFPDQVLQEVRPLSQSRKYVIVSALCAAIFLASLDNTIMATALPTIANHFNASSSISWIVAANFLTTTCFQPLYGKLSDIFGRKESILTAIAIFITGSLISGLARSIPMLIFSRAFTGIGGAGMFVMVQIIISEMVTIQERGLYTGLIGVAVGSASVIGPLIGGVFTDKIGYQWCFFVSVLVGIVAGSCIYFLIKIPKPQGRIKEKIKRVDFQGIFSLIFGLTMILLALNFGSNGKPWTGTVVLTLMISGILTILGFVFIELKLAKEPILPLHLFNVRNVWSVVLAQFFMGFALYGLIYYIPMYDTIVNNATASKAGLFMLPFIITLVTFSILTGVAITKTGYYCIFFRSGVVLLSIGSGMLISLNTNTSSGLTKFYMCLCGCGCGLTMQSLIVCIQAAVSKKMIASATSAVMFARMLSATVGNVLASVVYKSIVNSRASVLIQEYPDSKDKILAALENTKLLHDLSLGTQISSSLLNAYIQGLKNVFIMFCVVSIISFIFTMATKHISLKSKIDDEALQQDSQPGSNTTI